MTEALCGTVGTAAPGNPSDGRSREGDGNGCQYRTAGFAATVPTVAGWISTGDPAQSVVATVSSEHGTVVVEANDGVTFGRGAEADVRIGAVPIYDGVVPRAAGRIFAVAGRVVVENLDDQLAFDLRLPARPIISLSPGDWHSPRETNFDIVVTGTVTFYELAVAVNASGITPRRFPFDASADELDPPTGAIPTLTERHRRIMDAYIEPLRAGGLVASHQQVADRLGISRSLVRVECERIWSALFLAGVPMRDLGDARDEIVDAWSRHRI